MLGALDLYRDRVGELSREQFADALVVAAQLEIGVYEAMDRLRARAYAEDVSLTDLAVSVVDRGIRFGPDWPL